MLVAGREEKEAIPKLPPATALGVVEPWMQPLREWWTTEMGFIIPARVQIHTSTSVKTRTRAVSSLKQKLSQDTPQSHSPHMLSMSPGDPHPPPR